MENTTVEQWKSVKDFETIYEVSDRGNVKSLGNDKSRKEKILKPQYNPQGYACCTLYSQGIKRQVSVHSLVAEAFLGDKPQDIIREDGTVEFIDIDHISTDKTDNSVENLRYCTHSENIAKIKTYDRKKSRPVDCYTQDGRFVAHYDCLSDVEKFGHCKLAVSKVCRGLTKSGLHHNLVWMFAEKKEK